MLIAVPIPKTSRQSALPRLRPSPYPSTFSPLSLPSRPPAIPSLPLEITSLIIKSIGSEDVRTSFIGGENEDEEEEFWLEGAFLQRATLTRCCLVSKAFLGAARECLYDTVSLGQGYDHEIRLLDTLERSSLLAAMVKRLVFESQPPADGGEFCGCLDRALEACFNTKDLFFHLERHRPASEELALGAALDAFDSIVAQRPDLESILISYNIMLYFRLVAALIASHLVTAHAGGAAIGNMMLCDADASTVKMYDTFFYAMKICGAKLHPEVTTALSECNHKVYGADPASAAESKRIHCPPNFKKQRAVEACLDSKNVPADQMNSMSEEPTPAAKKAMSECISYVPFSSPKPPFSFLKS
ncbi:hypothetical protein RQP46_004847 [Phenoliferia psychrophenolica]